MAAGPKKEKANGFPEAGGEQHYIGIPDMLRTCLFELLRETRKRITLASEAGYVNNLFVGITLERFVFLERIVVPTDQKHLKLTNWRFLPCHKTCHHRNTTIIAGVCFNICNIRIATFPISHMYLHIEI